MTVPRPSIASVYPREMVASLDPGLRRDVLASVGIPETRLHDETFRVDQRTYYRLHHAVVEAADDELFGFMRRRVPRGAFARLVRLLSRLRTLRDCVEAGADFYALFDGGPHWALIEQGGIAELRVTPRTPGQAASILFVHMMWVTPLKTAAWLVGQPLRARTAVLEEGLARYAPETRYLLGCAPLIGDHSALTLPPELLEARVLRRPEEVESWLEISLGELISPPAPATIEIALREQLATARPVAGLSLPQAARRLGCSRATLARRLQAVGTSFQGVKDELRRDFAMVELARPEVTVEALAETLGYSDSRAFRRAFKAWTGAPPSRFRPHVRE